MVASSFLAITMLRKLGAFCLGVTSLLLTLLLSTPPPASADVILHAFDWSYATVAERAPDIAAATKSAPQISGSTGKKNVAAMDLVIPKSTDAEAAALKFATYVTNDANQLAFAKDAKVLPSTVGAMDDSYFTDVAEDATPVEVARSVSASQLGDAAVLIPAMEDVKELQKIIYDNLQAAMLEDKTVDQAVADAADEWNNR